LKEEISNINKRIMDELTSEELARYGRNVILPGIGKLGQEKLKRARVLIVGLGGLGSPVAMYLCAAGVGTLGLADMDVIEEHNLQRQVLHDTLGIERKKVDSAKERLANLNPHCRLVIHETGVRPDNVLEILAQYDLVVDGTDNFPTRYLMNDAAYMLNKPLVYGSLFQYEGQVTVFEAYKDGPCYRCLFPEVPEPGTVPNCSEAGILGALCGVIGSLQAMEALKFIVGLGEPLSGQMLTVASLAGRFQKMHIKKDPKCPLCGTHPRIISIEASNYEFECTLNREDHLVTEGLPYEVEAETVADWLKSGEVLLLDVRESYEVDICRLEGSVHIPMGELPERFQQIPKNKTVVVYCHHGGRSLYMTNFLREKGWDNATNLMGGIEGWARKIDPSMRRY